VSEAGAWPARHTAPASKGKKTASRRTFDLIRNLIRRFSRQGSAKPLNSVPIDTRVMNPVNTGFSAQLHTASIRKAHPEGCAPDLQNFRE